MTKYQLKGTAPYTFLYHLFSSKKQEVYSFIPTILIVKAISFDHGFEGLMIYFQRHPGIVNDKLKA